MGPQWRHGTHDTQGVVTDETVGLVLSEVESAVLSRERQGPTGAPEGPAVGDVPRVAWHMEPYKGG